MRTGNPLVLFIILLTSMTVTGCQDSPLMPDTGTSPALAHSSSASSTANHQNLGYYTLVVDTETLTVNVIQAKTGEIHLNVVGTLNTSMGVSVVGVPALHDPLTGLFVFDVTLTHPFGTKPQLAGFDVKGILITPGSLIISPLVFADADETRLENADGYTRWWNPTEFTEPGMFGYTQGILANASAPNLTATVNPYKYFADILAADNNMSPVHGEPLDSDTGRGVFTAGSSNTRRYMIRFPMDPGPQVTYGYAVDASWSLPNPNPPLEIPDDFPFEANSPEPYDVVVGDTVNTLFYDSESGVGGGVLRLLVNVHDWQGQNAGNIPGEISAVKIFAPDLMPGSIDGTFYNVTPIKARYTADLTGLAIPSEAGETVVMCRVGSSDGSTYKQTGAPAPEESLSAFQVISLDIPDPECVADSNNDFPEAVELATGGSAIDQVCLPDDIYDYYYFEIPLGYAATGEVRLYTGAHSISLGIFDDTETLLDGITSDTGQAVLDLDGLDLMPGKYYIVVMHSGTDAVLPYYLELDEQLVNVIPSNPIDVTPSTLFVNPEYVWVHDDYAYLLGQGIWVYDISNPADPVQVFWDLEMKNIDAADFSYPYCYLTHWVSPDYLLSVIDFTNPLSPVLYEDVIQITDDFADITMNSTHLYVGTSLSPISEVKIFNYITDPLNPSEIGSVAVPYEPHVLGLLDPEGPETHLVVGTWGDILTYDVENVLSITPAGIYNFPLGTPRDVTTWQDYIYVAYDASGGGEGWLYVLLQTTIPSLVEEGNVDLPGSASHVAANWPYVYVGDGGSGLTICDVTTPASPTHTSSTPMNSRGFDLAVQDDHVFIISLEDGLDVMDVSTPSSPVTVSRLRVINDPWGMQVTADYLLVGNTGNWTRSIKTIDISDPPNAAVVGEIYLTDPPGHLRLDGNILASGIGMQWKLFDAGDPLNLVAGGSGTTTNFLQAIGVFGTTLYVSYESAVGPEVEIYDISNIASPSYVNSLILADICRGICFAEGHMYLRTSPEILVYSVADPLNPVPVGNYPKTDVRDFAARGDYLHMVTNDIVEIADISTPSSPVFAGATSLPVADWLERIIVDGQFAYITVMDAPPYSCWVWPPDSPTPLAPVHDNDAYGGGNLAVHNGYLYQSTESAGIRIYDLY